MKTSRYSQVAVETYSQNKRDKMMSLLFIGFSAPSLGRTPVLTRPLFGSGQPLNPLVGPGFIDSAAIGMQLLKQGDGIGLMGRFGLFGLSHRTDITTYLDLVEADEGRM